MKTLTLLALILITLSAHAQHVEQDSIRTRLNSRAFKETSLTFGYHYNFEGKQDGIRPARFHFAEVGVWRSYSIQGHHPFFASMYFANDIGLNTNRFVIGPKVGAFFCIMVIGLGTEFIYYTDFEKASLRWIPSVGLFTPYFKLTMNPHVVFMNSDFYNFNKGHINLTVKAFRLRQKEISKTQL
jgi:hypothetical protein